MSFAMKNSLGTELVQESILLDRHDLCTGIHTPAGRVLQVITAHNVQDRGPGYSGARSQE